MPAAAYAQSTGTVEAENKAIVITGSRARDVGGVTTPDTPKAKVVLTQEIISRSNPGQTILDTINLVPGVSFQNNDAYGSSGGTLNIRGFDSTRISLTFDGIQLNDSGNYAIFSNQQIDPELIEQVNVNLGSTDVDSPTASAVGGTVNYRTMTPTKDFGVRINAGFGDWNYWRLFGMVNTGEIGPFHTRAFFAASRTKNDLPFNQYGKISKQQYNGKIWQPIGSSGDFVSISGHYNQNRNNFFGSLPLRQDLDIGITNSPGDRLDRLVGPNSNNRYPRNRDERFFQINFPCQVDTPQAGVADSPAPAPFGQASCGTEFDRRYNPSNTGNVRIASKFTITDGLVLTVDPSYQYVKANGGGTVTGREGFATFGGAPHTGFIAGNYWFGVDLNGDGDVLDTCVSTATGGCTTATNTRGVTLLAPSQTHTDRYGVIAGLRWDFAQGQMVRVSYTLDDAHHRQTGEVGLLEANGEPVDVFPINDPLSDANGNLMEKRDRKSRAILNQVSGEYRGDFFDNKLTVNVGLRAPFFIRRLQNFCFTTSASGFFDCFGQDAVQEAAYALAFPAIQGPQKRKFKYDKLLPNVGLVYDLTRQLSVFGNYSKGLSVPSTDNLYNSFFFAPDTEQAKPKPEVTDSFDGGLRYRRANIQAQISGWYTHFTNRQAQAFDPELNTSVFRNLGTVNKWGIDGSIAYEPIRQVTLYAFGSWNKSKIADNIQVAALPVGVTCDNIDPTTPQAFRSCAFTKGNRESGSPKYTYGVSAVGDLGPVTLGVEAKRTGPRFIFDNNQAMFRGDVDCPGTVAAGCPATTPLATPQVIFGKTAPAYWLVNLDARVKLAAFSPSLKDTYLQLNVYNLFDKFYVGGFGGGLNQSISASTGVWGNPPFVQIGAPRTVSASINVQF
ncbi:MAG TPA: TonB-dependent receptor [Sphingomicrobium sp.]|nr:TonB-dependent receptor [Sphingomicrobium sp.]